MSTPEIKFTPVKSYMPFHSANDPCPPIGAKYYCTPPHLYLSVQPMKLDQFKSPKDALAHGTLWPFYYDPYNNPYKK